LAHKIGRWLSAFIGLIVIGLSLICIPSATSVKGLIIPNFCMGFSIGMIDASMFPMMGYIVDLRHVGVYGSIYAIADTAFCFAFAIGPFVSGPLVRGIGFPAMMYLIAFINFCYAPLMFFLRQMPPISHETTTISGQQLNGTPSLQGHQPGMVVDAAVRLDTNRLNYDRIDGVTMLATSDPLVTREPSYRYDINSVWDD